MLKSIVINLKNTHTKSNNSYKNHHFHNPFYTKKVIMKIKTIIQTILIKTIMQTLL